MTKLIDTSPALNRMGNPKLVRECRYLQTNGHFYCMSTKKGSDGNVHEYFNPYSCSYEAFLNYMNVLADVEYRLKGRSVEVPAEMNLFIYSLFEKKTRKALDDDKSHWRPLRIPFTLTNSVL